MEGEREGEREGESKGGGARKIEREGERGGFWLTYDETTMAEHNEQIWKKGQSEK